jgi:hypothetical protein
VGISVRLPGTVAQVVSGAAAMRVRGRRRLDAVLLAIAGLLVGGVAAAGAVLGDDVRISAVWAGAAVAGDGSAQVVEVIDYDFGVWHRHGILREVPGMRQGSVQVSSATAPDDVLVQESGLQTQIRVGDPSLTVTGRHRYRLRYLLDRVAPDARLAWNAVGTGWPVTIGDVRVDVVAPFEFRDPRCVRGVIGSTTPCRVAQPEPGHLVAELHGLRAHQGATLYAAGGHELAAAPPLPMPASDRPADTTSGLLPAGLLAAAVALVGAVPASRLVRRAGRERVAVGGAADAAWGGAAGERRVDTANLESLATIEFAPPAELTAAQGGVLLAEGVRDEHRMAWLIGAAIDGYLDIKGDGPAITLVRGDRHDGSPTAEIIDRAFGGSAATGDRLRLGSYNPSFAVAWRRIGGQLEHWHWTSDLWDPAGDVRRRLARRLGAVAAVGGLAVAALGGGGANRWGWGWLAVLAWGALLAGAGLAAAVCAWELRMRTPKGSGLWLRVESFRRFLAQSEAHHADEAAKRGVLRQYTAWAVAVGELDRWSRAVAASATAADPIGVRYSRAAVWLPDSTSETLIEPTRSSGDGGGRSGGGWSGGGGGGVGGGSGGGGGGDW